MFAATPVGLFPFPALCVAVLVPYPVVEPNSKYQLVSSPFGSTEPVRRADVVERVPTEPVAAAGDAACALPASSASEKAATRSAPIAFITCPFLGVSALMP